MDLYFYLNLVSVILILKVINKWVRRFVRNLVKLEIFELIITKNYLKFEFDI